jgi:hypothetical protein
MRISENHYPTNIKKARDDKGYWNQIEGYIKAWLTDAFMQI